jgi:hypothetical protein
MIRHIGGTKRIRKYVVVRSRRIRRIRCKTSADQEEEAEESSLIQGDGGISTIDGLLAGSMAASMRLRRAQ